MHMTKRKTGFIGLLSAIKTIQNLFNLLDKERNAPLKYILTYKFSQDHLELLFGAIRSAGGINNNPTTKQFTAAYKRLLMRSSIQSGTGICQAQDQTNITYAFGDSIRINDTEVTITHAYLIRKYGMTEREPLEKDHDYNDS